MNDKPKHPEIMYVHDPDSPVLKAIPACPVDFRSPIEKQAEVRANALVLKLIAEGHL